MRMYFEVPAKRWGENEISSSSSNRSLQLTPPPILLLLSPSSSSSLSLRGARGVTSTLQSLVHLLRRSQHALTSLCCCCCCCGNEGCCGRRGRGIKYIHAVAEGNRRYSSKQLEYGSSKLTHPMSSGVKEWASKRVSARANECAVWANEQTNERMAQYSRTCTGPPKNRISPVAKSLLLVLYNGNNKSPPITNEN